MKKRLFYGILVNTMAIIFAAQLAYLGPAWEFVTAENNFYMQNSLYYLGAGFVLSLVNTVVRPVLVILSLPLNIITFGLFSLVINTMMVMLTSALTPGFNVPGFRAAFIVALIVSLANWLFSKLEI